MIYLDTHVIIYLAGHIYEEISQSALDMIEAADRLLISPIIELELQYLYEVKRIERKPMLVIDYLVKKINLETCSRPFEAIIKSSLTLHWTRDPFDRIITATATLEDSVLVTADKLIRKHYKHAVW